MPSKKSKKQSSVGTAAQAPTADVQQPLDNTTLDNASINNNNVEPVYSINATYDGPNTDGDAQIATATDDRQTVPAAAPVVEEEDHHRSVVSADTYFETESNQGGKGDAHGVFSPPVTTAASPTDSATGGGGGTVVSSSAMKRHSAAMSGLEVNTDPAAVGGAFVRHQFFKGHRASPFSPTNVFVDASHHGSQLAAEYAHTRASYLLEKAAKKQQAEEEAASPTSSTKTNRMGRWLGGLLGGDAAERERLVGDGDDSAYSAAKVDVGTRSQRDGDGGNEAPHPHRAKSSRRFTGYFFDDTAEARKRTLTALTLLGIMFCNSIGGGYGLEESIGAGGALITILGVVILPLIWALPVSMCVAELATSVPTNGGYLMWINVSMPAPVYFFNVVATVFLMFIDNAVYPVLFSDYLCQAIDCSDSLHTGLKVAVLGATCALNLVGVEAVGWMTILITVMSISPFFTMFLMHMIKTGGYVNWDNMKAIPADIDWTALMATLAWNVAGLEQAGSVAEDVKDPQKNFMRAVIPLMGLVWLSYIPPIVAGVSRTHGAENWGIWESGYFATVGDEIGGAGLKMFIVVGGLFSAFGLLLSCLCLSSRTLAGTGEAAAFPRPISKIVYAYNERFGTPHWAIIINTICTGVCAVLLDFSSLVAIDQALYGIRILMIFLSAIKLRYAYPQLERPFKIPVSADGLVALLAIPILFSLSLVILCAANSQTTAIAFGCLCVGLSIFSYLYCRYFRPHGFDGKIIRVFSVEGLMRAQHTQDAIDVDAVIRSMQMNSQHNPSEAAAEGHAEGGGRTIAVVEDVEGVAYAK